MNKSLTVSAYLLIIFLSLIIAGCKSDNIVDPPFEYTRASDQSSRYAIEWMEQLFDVVSFQDIPAPVCSRLYGYAGITIYESIRYGIPGARSLAGQLNQMPSMPVPSKEAYDWPSVMAAALSVVSKGIIYNPHNYSLSLIDEVYTRQITERRDSVGSEITDRSIAYGNAVGEKILQWAASDNFLATRNMPYTPPSRQENPAFWAPTYPTAKALEPYLGTQRPFCLTKQDQCAVPLTVPFDTVPGSGFHTESMEVYNKSKSLTQDERNIALFWEDKGGTGQPPGHWVAITNNMIARFNLSLAETAKLYALVGSAIRDAFISCWEAKYRVNLLRPKTYIRDYIDPVWVEFISTPPFPEYPSGHSVVSGAVAHVLTVTLGDNIAFVDSTHGNRPGLRNRTFTSFNNAAEEAAWSRLYGGIHYRSAIINGVEQGREVARVVLSTIRFN